jgi:hypothetical protein
MESTYQPELWRDMFVLLGSSAAALIGLLFIAAAAAEPKGLDDLGADRAVGQRLAPKTANPSPLA